MTGLEPIGDEWLTTVTFGPRSTLPRGPWHTREEATAALRRWEARTGGTWSPKWSGGGSLRVNAYRTRATARAGSVSDAPGRDCLSSEPVSNFLRGTASW